MGNHIRYTHACTLKVDAFHRMAFEEFTEITLISPLDVKVTMVLSEGDDVCHSTVFAAMVLGHCRGNDAVFAMLQNRVSTADVMRTSPAARINENTTKVPFSVM